MADDGVLGSGEDCPADSCLGVLEDGSPSGSGDFWIAPYGLAYLEYCDFGTVASGWDYRQEISIDNPTQDVLLDHPVAIELDTTTLIADGKLQADGADLRFFTHDGPLMEYWFEHGDADFIAAIWVVVPELPAGAVTDFTLTYGNPDTERRSLSWLFDGFAEDTSALYESVFDANWGNPWWTWDVADEALEVHNTNQDFYLQALEDTVDLEVPIYVEVQGYMVDNDALGAMVRDESGALITAVSSNDYDGVGHNGGLEAIVEHSTVPSGHYLGAYLLDVGNINDIYNDTRIGLYYDGSGLHYYLDGVWQDSAAGTLDLVGAGLGCFACQGAPGAGFLHLWIGGTPIDFDPSAVTSDATATLAGEQAF